MGRWFLVVCMWAMLSCDACAELKFDWARVIHIKPIRSAMLADTLGVSNDKRKVIVWHAATGLPIAAWNDIGGNVQQSWITKDLKSVVAVVHHPEADAPRRVMIYWLNIALQSITDSMALENVETPDTNKQGFAAQSDLSADGKRLGVVLYRRLNKYEDGFTTLFVVNLANRRVELMEPRESEARVLFELNDAKVTTFTPQSADNVWHSPSGYYSWGTSWVWASERSVPYLEGMQESYEPVRWSVTDAAMLARQVNYKGYYTEASYGPVRLINLCTKQVIVDVVVPPYDKHGIWCTPDMKRVVGFSANGQVVVWTLPDLAPYDSLCVATTLPDIVMTDTLHDIDSYWFPGNSNHKFLVDRCDGSTPVNTQFISWNEPGEQNIRFGREENGQVTWTPKRRVVVNARVPADAARPSLRMDHYISAIFLTKDNRILVSGDYEHVYELDKNLRCTRGVAGITPWQDADLVGSSDDSSFILKRQTTTYDLPSYTTGSIQGTFIRVSLNDYTCTDSILTEKMLYSGSSGAELRFDVVDQSSSDEIWVLQQCVTSKLGLRSLNVLSDFSMTPRAEQCLSDNSIFLKHTSTSSSAVNSSKTHAVFLPSRAASPSSRPREVLITNLQTGLCETLYIEKFPDASHYAMFMNSDVVISDNLLIRVNPSPSLAFTEYEGPFTRTVPEEHAITWQNREFLRIDANGNIVGRAPGPKERPYIMRSLPDGRLIIGNTTGVHIYGSPIVSVDDELSSTTNGGLSISPQPASSTLRIRPSHQQTDAFTTIVITDITGSNLGEWHLPTSLEYTIDISAVYASTGVHVLRVRSGSSTEAALITISR